MKIGLHLQVSAENSRALYLILFFLNGKLASVVRPVLIHFGRFFKHWFQLFLL